jgi:hypothetical protein
MRKNELANGAGDERRMLLQSEFSHVRVVCHFVRHPYYCRLFEMLVSNITNYADNLAE